jgi:hypothetical protein
MSHNDDQRRFDGMPTLRIEHAVPSFEMWKQAFDNDPADRKGSGVNRYRISRGIDDPNFVTIDLDFSNVADAQKLLEFMEQVWAGPGKAFMMDPRARIVESVEDVNL